MPLLKRGTEIFPPNLFELPEGDFPWWVAHTLSRQEKAVARHLLPMGIPFFLPHQEKRTRRSGRSFTSFLPLFPGYIFFRGPASARHAALQSDLLVRVLEVPDQGLLNRELAQLRALQERGASFVPYEELRPGDFVRVTDGPFEGYSGTVLRGQSRMRLVVSVTMLQKAVAVEFERSVLTPLNSSLRPEGDIRGAVA